MLSIKNKQKIVQNSTSGISKMGKTSLGLSKILIKFFGLKTFNPLHNLIFFKT